MSKHDDRFPPDPETRFTIDCDDLDFALEGFIEKQGYRLFSIFPADGPREAIVEREGSYVKLKKAAERAGIRDDETSSNEAAISRPGNSEWHEGRAGMQYRDLLPDRAGGSLIASHIRIPEGGPVPDYVHFHNVDFQVIYCLSGSCKLVYESQGKPFEFAAGDCVLQPPGIRHRVLECSDGFEVLELSSPAEHATYADHDLELPNGPADPEKRFGGHMFHRHVSNDSERERIDLGLEYPSSGAVIGELVRLRGSEPLVIESGGSNSSFAYILDGGVEVSGAGPEPEMLAEGSSLFIPQETPLDLVSEDATVLLFQLRI
ncbi:MAG: cupin domain-containing protein [Acidobacteriota bacterium]|nr:MAG: cupin domain-containing protein [Acidobacteriota bacterium]